MKTNPLRSRIYASRGQSLWIGTLLMLGLSASAIRADIVADFAREAIYENVLVSPSGKYLAVVYRDEGVEYLSVIDRASHTHLSKIGFGDRMGVVDVVWANDERLLIWPAQRFWSIDFKAPTGEIIGMNADGRHNKRLFGWRADENSRGTRVRRAERTWGWSRLVDVLPDDPNRILIEVRGFSAEGQTTRAVRLDVRNGRQRDLIGSPVREGSFVPSRTGDVEFSFGLNSNAEYALYHRPDGKGQFQSIMTRTLDQGRIVPLAAYDSSTYIVYDDEDAPTQGLSLWNTRTGEKQLLFRHPRVDLLNAHFGWGDRSPYALKYVDHFPDYYYPDAERPLAAVHRRIRGTFPEDDVTFTSVTRDNNLAVALVQGDRNPGTFYLVDVKAGSITRIQDKRPWLEKSRLAKMDPVALTVRDQMSISGYLTTPSSFSSPGPLVVYVHGGPHGVQDVWGFDEEVQLLAAAGYAVLQVNYRGSAGFGRNFESAGYGEWGAAMQDDVTDATRWAIAEGIADPERICIFGGSYGGYAALTGSFREPDLYRCAVGYAGVYDLPLMFERGDIPRMWMGEAYLASTLGTDTEVLKARSPVHNAARIEANVMLVAGGLDERAPVEHSERMRHALEAAGKDVEWVLEKREGHGFFNPENRAELYRRLLAFLNRSIGE